MPDRTHSFRITMDFGDMFSIDFASFTSYNELELQDFHALVSFINTIHKKLFVTTSYRTVLEQYLRVALARHDLAGSRVIVRHTSFRVAQYRTTLHTLYRYQLILSHDLMRAYGRLSDLGYGRPPSALQ